MKKVLSLLIISIFLLTSCTLGDSDMIKDIFAMDDQKVANKEFEMIIYAIENQDKFTLKSLFSDNALEDAQNLNEIIDELFDYYQGKMLSYYDWGGPRVYGGMNDDGTERYWKKMNATYDVETSRDKYRFAMEFIPIDTSDAANVGIRSLYVIKLKDDTDPKFAYRGDRKYTPGININKKNIISHIS